MPTIANPPTSFTFRTNRQQVLTWVLQDGSGNPITGAQVTATLYVNRDSQNVSQYPGTPLSPINNLTLTETPPSSGTYQGTIVSSFNPSPSTTGFTLVVTSKDGLGNLLDISEVPAVVIFPENLIDLVTLDQVKLWLGIRPTNTDDDVTLQFLITSFSS